MLIYLFHNPTQIMYNYKAKTRMCKMCLLAINKDKLYTDISVVPVLHTPITVAYVIVCTWAARLSSHLFLIVRMHVFYLSDT